MLEANQLTKRFSGVAVVRDVSFQVEPGQILGYLGPNGSGKTTTVNMLMGFLQPSSGSVTFRGQGIHRDLGSYRSRVGFVPEESHVYPVRCQMK
jgi:ABC-2 type transport system ATP-binding protein